MRKRACQIRHCSAVGYLCSMLMGFHLHISTQPELFCAVMEKITMVLAKVIIISGTLKVIKLM